MKELNAKHKDEIKQVAQKQVEKRLVKINDLFIHPGQKCYEYNQTTKQIGIATMEVIVNPFATGKKIDIYNPGKTEGESKVQQKIIQKPDCRYVVAINERNALRKLLR